MTPILYIYYNVVKVVYPIKRQSQNILLTQGKSEIKLKVNNRLIWFHLDKNFENHKQTIKNYEKTMKKPSTARKPQKTAKNSNLGRRVQTFS